MSEKPTDYVNRGVHGFNVGGTLTMGTLRLLDPVLQFAILTRRLDVASVLPRIFGGRLAPPHPSVVMGLSLASVNTLPAYQQLLLSITAGSVVKHLLWLGYIAQEDLPPSGGLMIGIFNNVFNSFNSVFSLWSVTSPVGTAAYADATTLLKNPAIVLGSTLFVTGLLMETVSEIQRKQFKSNPENKGKAFTGGLFKLARHINYGGYNLWRAGAALVGGGWIWSGVVFSFFFFDFTTRAIPALDGYCSKRYGEQWTNYKSSVKYRLIPGIY